MSAFSANVDLRRPLPNPWRWSSLASARWQIFWAGALAGGILLAAVILLPDTGRTAVALAHVVFHELGHAALAVFGDGQVHKVAISPHAGHVLHTAGTGVHAALVLVGGLLVPALIAALTLVAGVIRQGLEVVLLTLAITFGLTASYAVTDSPATELSLYLFAGATLLVACLPGAALAKAAACLVWTAILLVGLWNAAPGLFTEPSQAVADRILLSDTQKLAILFGVEVEDIAVWVVAAQIAIPLFAALWVANWMAHYRI